MRPFYLHLVITFIWVMLQGGGIPSLITGWLFGYALLAFFNRFFSARDYLRRHIAFLVFVGVFLRELAYSNYTLARSVLFQSTSELHPGFVEYDVPGLSHFELYLLSQCITLTPGTTTVEVSDDEQRLTVHAFDARDPDALCRSIDQSLKKAILAFTR